MTLPHQDSGSDTANYTLFDNALLTKHRSRMEERAMADRHPNCIHPLCGCLRKSDCKQDPMNTPLPCDVKVGATTFRKGVKLGVFVTAAQHWHREAFPEFYALTDEQKAANLARLQGCSAGEPQHTNGGSHG